MPIRSYRDLVVWKKGMELVKNVYEFTNKFPKQEMYGLSSQIQRAAVSIPANIAEGHARSSTKEFLHHLSFARGSLAELETLLTLARDLNYCQDDIIVEFFHQCDQISRMISGLRNRLKQKMNRDS
jgi:four helix bundle protein